MNRVALQKYNKNLQNRAFHAERLIYLDCIQDRNDAVLDELLHYVVVIIPRRVQMKNWFIWH
jgi:hypothetical protein